MPEVDAQRLCVVTSTRCNICRLSGIPEASNQQGAPLPRLGLDREPTMLDPEAREKARVHGEAEAAATRALNAGSTSAPTFGTVGDPAEAERCRELVSKALDRDEKVHTLREALTKLGVATGNMVHCEHCPDGLAAAGGYVPSERRVVLCQQWAAKMPTEVSNTLAHELVRSASNQQ
jgi:hypothetical protein